jgi:hypothetical protein
MKKRDLVFWVTRNGYKFWSIIGCIKKGQAYTVTDSCSHWISLDKLVPASIEQVIQYERRKWKTSAFATRNRVEIALKLVDSISQPKRDDVP